MRSDREWKEGDRLAPGEITSSESTKYSSLSKENWENERQNTPLLQIRAKKNNRNGNAKFEGSSPWNNVDTPKLPEYSFIFLGRMAEVLFYSIRLWTLIYIIFYFTFYSILFYSILFAFYSIIFWFGSPARRVCIPHPAIWDLEYKGWVQIVGNSLSRVERAWRIPLFSRSISP